MSRPSVLLLVLLSLCGSEVTRGDGEMAPLLGNEATDKIPDEYVVLLDNVHGSPQQVSDSLTEWVTQQVDTNQCHFSVRRPFELGQRLFLHVDACSDAVLAVRRHEHVTQVETNRIFRLTATPGAGSEECDELRQTGWYGSYNRVKLQGNRKTFKRNNSIAFKLAFSLVGRLSYGTVCNFKSETHSVAAAGCSPV